MEPTTPLGISVHIKKLIIKLSAVTVRKKLPTHLVAQKPHRLRTAYNRRGNKKAVASGDGW